MSQFKQLKFRVRDAEDLKNIQEHLYSMGYEWYGGSGYTDPKVCAFIFGESNGRILKDSEQFAASFEGYEDYEECEVEIVPATTKLVPVSRVFQVAGKRMSLAEVKEYINNLEEAE